MANDESKITIGRFSTITRLSQKSLRIYDEIGLLKPNFKDPATGYRYYSLSQIEKGLKIKILRDLGFNPKEIVDLMELNPNNAEFSTTLESLMKKKVTELQKRIDRLKSIKSILLRSKKFEDLIMAVSEPKIKEIEEIRVVSKRQLGTYSETIPKLIQEIFQQIYRPENNPALLKISGPIIGIFHDQEYKEFDADIEIAVPIVGKIVVDDDFEVKKLPKTKVLFVVHTGPYDQVGIAFDRAYQYVRQNNLVITGSVREVYLNDPHEVPEEQLLTEIQIPIQ